jgi:hypothetical protein
MEARNIDFAARSVVSRKNVTAVPANHAERRNAPAA